MSGNDNIERLRDELVREHISDGIYRRQRYDSDRVHQRTNYLVRRFRMMIEGQWGYLWGGATKMNDVRISVDTNRLIDMTEWADKNANCEECPAKEFCNKVYRTSCGCASVLRRWVAGEGDK